MHILNHIDSETISKKLANKQCYNVENSLNRFSKNKKAINYLSKEDVDGLFYPTLDKLLEESGPLGHQFFVARDYYKEKDAKWVKQFTSFPTAKEYLEILPLLNEKARTFNEIVRPNQQVKPVFDIEWYEFKDTSERNRVNPEEAIMELWEKITAAFKQLFSVDLELDGMRILESHKIDRDMTKFSYHLIIDGYRLKDLSNYGKHLANTVIELIKRDKDCLLNRVLDADKKEKVPIDMNIYKGNQGIRIMGHHKQDELNRMLKTPNEIQEEDPVSYLLTESERDNF